MDIKTLKALVVEMRDKDKLTFQAIADKLSSEYNVDRSRQSIQGLYARATAKKNNTNDKMTIILTTDIVNIYCLGYSISGISHMLRSRGYNLDYNKISNILGKEKEYVEKVKSSIINKVAEQLDLAIEKNAIRSYICYRDIPPVEKALNQYISDGYTKLIIDSVKNKLNEVYNFTDNKQIVKDIIKNLISTASKADIIKLLNSSR